MVAIPKIVERLSAIMVFIGSFQAAHIYAEDSAGYEISAKPFEMTVDLATQTPMKKGLSVQIRQDKALRVEGSNDFVKDQNGKDLRLILDPSYQKIATNHSADRVEGNNSLGATEGCRVTEVAMTRAWPMAHYHDN